MKILLVEDEAGIREPLCALLKAQGWQIFCAGTAARAAQLAAQTPLDAALIDLGLPDGSGFDVIRAVRGAGDAAILVLTARTDEGSAVRSLEDGADDYIEKPFRARELIARLRAVWRRRARAACYRCGALELDCCAMQARMGGRPLELTAQEYRLLLVFLSHAGQLLERGQLLQLLWDQSGHYVNDNTLTVTVKRLREKLDLPQGAGIATVRGMGYRWEGRVDAQP